MMNKEKKTQVRLPSEREIEIRRTFNASRQLVWEMWTRSEHLVHWWGPTGWTLPVSEMDFRVGGAWFYCMEGPNGMKSCGRSVYKEIVEPERIVLVDYFTDDVGEVMPGMPEGQSTLVFEADGEKTHVIDTVLYPSKEARDKVLEMGMEAGIDQTLDRLEAYLATMQ